MTSSADKVPDSTELALVQDFVNTAHEGGDEIPDAASAVAWLGERGFEATLDDSHHRRLIETREHLRALFASNSEQPLPAATAARLARLLQTHALRVTVDNGAVRLLSSGAGVDGFVGRMVATLVESTWDGSLQRMKLCRAADCRWAFYDSSKNASGAWCSMRGCGTKAKARAYRDRRRPQ